MTRILVLMSTWNGGAFLEDQINSILNQKLDGEIRLLVRDDGSNDETLDILQRLKDWRIDILQGKNLGAKASFLELLRFAQGVDADFYALADQDDIWEADKIAAAIDAIGVGSGRPALYSSAVELVDQKLSHLSYYIHPGDRSFTSTLLCNYVTGCTCVFNNEFIELLCFPDDPSSILMHDWWLGTLAAAFADVVYDKSSHIKYRQHATNHVGLATGLKGIFLGFQRCIRAQKFPSRQTQARALYDVCIGKLPNDVEEILKRFLRDCRSPWSRVRFAWTERRHVSFITAIRFVMFS